MESISKGDLFVALLRQRLAERAQTQSARRKPAAGKHKTDSAPRTSVAALAAQAGADDPHLRRAIIEQLLGDRLGDRLVNEARFQQIVDQVTDIIADDEDLGGLLAEVMREVRRPV